MLVSILSTSLGHFRWAIWGGWVLTTAGSGLMILFGQDTKTPVWAGIFAVFGVGNGMVLTSVNIGVQAISRAEDCGRAASMYAFVRTLGMSVGVAVCISLPLIVRCLTCANFVQGRILNLPKRDVPPPHQAPPFNIHCTIIRILH